MREISDAELGTFFEGYDGHLAIGPMITDGTLRGYGIKPGTEGLVVVTDRNYSQYPLCQFDWDPEISMNEGVKRFWLGPCQRALEGGFTDMEVAVALCRRREELCGRAVIDVIRETFRPQKTTSIGAVAAQQLFDSIMRI